MKQSPANALTQKILHDLYTRGVFAWRQNTSGMPVRRGGVVVAVKSSGMVGVPDICSIWPPNGHFIGIEIKIEGDRLRPEQEGFKSSVTHVGGDYIVIHNWEDYLVKISTICTKLFHV